MKKKLKSNFVQNTEVIEENTLRDIEIEIKQKSQASYFSLDQTVEFNRKYLDSLFQVYLRHMRVFLNDLYLETCSAASFQKDDFTELRLHLRQELKDKGNSFIETFRTSLLQYRIGDLKYSPIFDEYIEKANREYIQIERRILHGLDLFISHQERIAKQNIVKKSLLVFRKFLLYPLLSFAFLGLLVVHHFNPYVPSEKTLRKAENFYQNLINHQDFSTAASFLLQFKKDVSRLKYEELKSDLTLAKAQKFFQDNPYDADPTIITQYKNQLALASKVYLDSGITTKAWNVEFLLLKADLAYVVLKQKFPSLKRELLSRISDSPFATMSLKDVFELDFHEPYLKNASSGLKDLLENTDANQLFERALLEALKAQLHFYYSNGWFEDLNLLIARKNVDRAIQFFDISNHPLDYALLKCLQGVIYFKSSEYGKKFSHFELANRAFQDALVVLSSEQFPFEHFHVLSTFFQVQYQRKINLILANEKLSVEDKIQQLEEVMKEYNKKKQEFLIREEDLKMGGSSYQMSHVPIVHLPEINL